MSNINAEYDRIARETRDYVWANELSLTEAQKVAYLNGRDYEELADVEARKLAGDPTSSRYASQVL